MKTGRSLIISVVVVGSSLILANCAKSPAEREVADDASCRKIIAERNDTRPQAYQECRGNLMEYERQRSLRASGNTTIINR